MKRWNRGFRGAGALGAGVLLAGLGALNLGCCSPLRVEPLRRATGEPVVDAHLELARTYAPWIYHAVHETRGRQDLPAPLDFDGNLDGEDNWEALPHFELVPTASYAVLETETHWFLTWHLFHPRDWTLIDLGLHLTHEGDGENLQVVVEKASGQVVLLFTQAHYSGTACARPDAGFGDGSAALRGELLLVNDHGLPDPQGTHAAVYVQSGGHGIYSARDRCSGAEIARDGGARFDGHGVVLRPARLGEAVVEPALDAATPVPYQLESTTSKLWPLLASGELVGEGRLLDGAWRYRNARVDIGVPRYHEADRFSGPFGPDRGISPFAVDFGWDEGTLGALFFDPARRYAELLNVPEPWSLEYVDYPFRTPSSGSGL